MSRAVEAFNRRMLRARDAMDRAYAQPLDIPALARVASISEAHFIRSFRATFGETPHHYLQRRRVERSMFLLRETDRTITDICFDVGFISLGTFSRTFREIIGETPTEYREEHGPMMPPNCFQMATTRPVVSAAQSSSFGEAVAVRAPLAWDPSHKARLSAEEEPRNDHQAERHRDHRPGPGGGARLLRQQAGPGGRQRRQTGPVPLADGSGPG